MIYSIEKPAIDLDWFQIPDCMKKQRKIHVPISNSIIIWAMIRLICCFNHEVHEEHKEIVKYFFTFVTLRALRGV